ncbi:MAG: hypothetical protein HQK49_00840 [Oligoflexia bacterium]|nr:hypothetical protein [Oligoflexia bacterium]
MKKNIKKTTTIKKSKINKKKQSPKTNIDELVLLKNNLDDLVDNMQIELERVKGLHSKYVPRRYKDFKGMQIISRYNAGDQSGGEFFDIISDNNILFLIMSHSTSYLSSNCVISLISKINEYKNSGPEDFIKTLNTNLIKNIEESFKPKYKGGKFIHPNLNIKHSIEILAAEIDLKALTVEGINLGTTLFSSQYTNFNTSDTTDTSTTSAAPTIPQDSERIDQFFNHYSFKYKLQRGEKLVILSPGFRKNIKDILDNIDINNFIKLHQEKKLPDLIDELFFQLKKSNDYNMSNNYPIYDSSSIIIEVNENVITEA